MILGLPLVLSIAVYGAGLKQAAASNRMRGERALRLLRVGLQRYADFAYLTAGLNG